MSIRDKYLAALETQEKRAAGIPPESAPVRIARKYQEALSRQPQTPGPKNSGKKQKS